MLAIYKLDESTATFSPISSQDFSSPASFSVTPGGSVLTKKFYIRNDDDTKYYTGVVLRPITTSNAAIASTAVTVKLLSGDKAPSDDRWNAVGANGPSNIITSLDPAACAVLQSPLSGGSLDTKLPEFGAAGTPDTKYYPFWIRVSAGKGAPISTLQFGLKATYVEGTV